MRLYYGTYGHHLSGKLYVYWGDDNLRTGQQVVAPVTNKRSGRTYNTMFTISKSSSEKNAAPEVGRLEGEGIFIKTIGGRDLLSLPGGKPFESKEAWRRESEERYRKKHNLPPLEKPVKSASATTSKPLSKSRPKPRKNGKRRRKAFKKQASKLLKGIGTNKKAINDSTAEAAKAALLSSRKVAADSVKQKERIKKMKQKEAFKE